MHKEFDMKILARQCIVLKLCTYLCTKLGQLLFISHNVDPLANQGIRMILPANFMPSACIISWCLSITSWCYCCCTLSTIVWQACKCRSITDQLDGCRFEAIYVGAIMDFFSFMNFFQTCFQFDIFEQVLGPICRPSALSCKA